MLRSGTLFVDIVKILLHRSLCDIVYIILNFHRYTLNVILLLYQIIKIYFHVSILFQQQISRKNARRLLGTIIKDAERF